MTLKKDRDELVDKFSAAIKEHLDRKDAEEPDYWDAVPSGSVRVELCAIASRAFLDRDDCLSASAGALSAILWYRDQRRRGLLPCRRK